LSLLASSLIRRSSLACLLGFLAESHERTGSLAGSSPTSGLLAAGRIRLAPSVFPSTRHALLPWVSHPAKHPFPAGLSSGSGDSSRRHRGSTSGSSGSWRTLSGRARTLSRDSDRSPCRALEAMTPREESTPIRVGFFWPSPPILHRRSSWLVSAASSLDLRKSCPLLGLASWLLGSSYLSIERAPVGTPGASWRRVGLDPPRIFAPPWSPSLAVVCCFRSFSAMPSRGDKRLTIASTAQ